jgi:hypothetical protein
MSDGFRLSSCREKLNNGGRSLPFGNRTPGSRSSLKNECAHASRGFNRLNGVYSKSLLTKEVASGGVRGLKTCHNRIIIIKPRMRSPTVCLFPTMSYSNLYNY